MRWHFYKSLSMETTNELAHLRFFHPQNPFPWCRLCYISISLLVFLSFKMLKRIVTVFWSAVEVKDKTSELLGRDCLFSRLKVLQQWNYFLMVRMFAFHNWSLHERSRDSSKINWKSTRKSKVKKSEILERDCCLMKFLQQYNCFLVDKKLAFHNWFSNRAKTS